MTQSPSPQLEIQQQAGVILSQVAGYVGLTTMETGLRSGLIAEIAKHLQGISADDLAKSGGLIPCTRRYGAARLTPPKCLILVRTRLTLSRHTWRHCC